MLSIRAALRQAMAWAVLLPAGLVAAGGGAQAQIGSARYASIVTDARGNIISAASPDELRHPASLTKMMTLYMAFEALKEGRISLGDQIRVSAEAASRPPSRLRLAPGATITVEEAILALVTKSANDAAAALGEFLSGGSEFRFAQMMTLRARALGMTRTTFRNASGLPDVEQVTTARDMALLGRRLQQDFPERYGYFSVSSFNFRGRTIFNHNRLLDEYDGTDGIKTGYVNDSGFNLVASAQRDGVRLVAAVFGGATGRERDRHMMALLDQGFAQFGVAPRVMAARRPAAPVLLAGARAATTQSASHSSRRGTAATTTSAARMVATPAPSLRLVTTRPARPAAAARRAARLEQGDAARSSAPATLRLPQRSLLRPVVAPRPAQASPARSNRPAAGTSTGNPRRRS